MPQSRPRPASAIYADGIQRISMKDNRVPCNGKSKSGWGRSKGSRGTSFSHSHFRRVINPERFYAFEGTPCNDCRASFQASLLSLHAHPLELGRESGLRPELSESLAECSQIAFESLPSFDLSLGLRRDEAKIVREE